MVTIDDIVQHITQQLHPGGGINVRSALKQLLESSMFDIHICITLDIEATELRYLQRYGKGHTFYFRLRDYEHGERLAKEFFYAMKAYYPVEAEQDERQFAPDTQLYLFINVLSMNPDPLAPEAPECNVPTLPFVGCGGFTYHY